MLNELTEKVNELTGLTGKELEAAVMIIGAAAIDAMIEIRQNGKPQDDLYRLNNYAAIRLYDIKKEIEANK